ncbi:MAG TPA: SpoIIE family protein phosphatase [Candidatus Brocadiia bacterium]|nr:SpoIIE family protein phosphatase [Candidatus Brocadiia bacterium]
MNPAETAQPPAKGAFKEHTITVLLVDDQAIIGEAVRRMLAGEKDIVYHYCGNPAKAVPMAEELKPTVILQDLVMPDIDGLTLVKFFRAREKTRDIPLIVLSTKEEATTKAEAFALGANDYLVKLPDRIELLARIRYHSNGYINLLQRNEAYQALVESQKALAKELSEAAEYVKSLLPPPMDGELKTVWEFIPSTSLGGDSFGYHWLDDNHFAMYLLDVCGHGVGAALLSISAMNVLRSQSLPNTDFRQPSQVLEALNAAFPMEEQHDMYFTIWYGVYDKAARSIAYSSGGHPPAILLTGDAPDALQPLELATRGFIIGGMPGVKHQTATVQLKAFNRLYVFSDGVYEVFTPTGELWAFEDFVKLLAQPPEPGLNNVQRVLQGVRKVKQSDSFDDDFSMFEVAFG